MGARILDTQVIELVGRNCLGSELLRDGLEVAVPGRDRGIDLVVYADLFSRVKRFIARPIQMKAASGRSFSIDRKYGKVANLIIAYVWHIHDPGKTVTYALTYRGALKVARKCWARARSQSWKRGRYSTNSPNRKLCKLLEPYRMTEGNWWKKVTGTKYQPRWGLKK
jgi:hypothetical protein